MDYLQYISACAFGLVLGLYLGRLLTAIISFRESMAAAAKTYMSLIAFALGGGSGAVIFGLFSGSHATLYVIGLAFGMFFTFFWPQISYQYTLETTTQIIKLGDAMQSSTPDAEKRAVLILALLTPPKSIERGSNISETELAKKLEEAADSVGNITTEDNSAL